MVKNLTFFCGCFLCLAFLVGCGPKTVSVSGTVSFDGEPAKDIRVLFQSTAQTALVAPPAIGLTDENGKFSLRLAETNKRGACPGPYSVYLSWNDPDAVEKPIEGVTVANECPYQIPTRATNGTLTFEVPDSGTDEANFEFETEAEEFVPIGV